ncbi:glycoside hydrolase family 16 protein [Endozoicomonas arenosclerae]|uniref:glycoside hydrolase family 16 protein n=1 Tax=Endozoicomonas arenosclerae TaxID=1633495 RepID=UPI000A6AD34D|nr:glycoside hydrolase family 16 protein [Endozoicomonas arenosclerae]
MDEKQNTDWRIARLLLTLVAMVVSNGSPASEWTLVWQDEFDYTGLPDSRKWNYEEGYIRNSELQTYTRDRRNARVEEGVLVIEAHQLGRTDANVCTSGNRLIQWWCRKTGREKGAFHYSSASLTTQSRFEWTHGRVEVRAKLPQGRGVWPAIWLLGASIEEVGWPATGEIDIMEFVGYQPDRIHAALHTESRNHRKGNAATGSLPVTDTGTMFHTYAVEWSNGSIDFYFDDQKYFSYQKEGNSSADWPFDDSMYLIINLAVGGGWGGKEGIDHSIFPQQYLIDFVRIYQHKLTAEVRRPKDMAKH